LTGPSSTDRHDSNRAFEFFTSTGFNTAVGLLGLATPLVPLLLLDLDLVKNIALGIAGLVIIGLVVRAQYVRGSSIHLRCLTDTSTCSPLRCRR
jgi:hypothetical protein